MSMSNHLMRWKTIMMLKAFHKPKTILISTNSQVDEFVCVCGSINVNIL